MRAIIVQAIDNGDEVEMMLAIGDTDSMVVKAVNEKWSIVPLAWEYDENIYNLVIIAPSYMVAPQIALDATPIINAYVGEHVRACHECMVSDEEIDNTWRGK